MKRYNIPFSPPDISESEIQEVAETLRSGWITTGPRTKRFETEIAAFCNTERAVCLNSATAALELTLRVLGIGEGDEVITTAYTYTATASVVCHVGARLVLVDTSAGSYEMDYAQLEKAITPKTKAILPVDIAGVICDYDTIFEIVRKKQSLFTPKNAMQRALSRIAVVTDAAHAFGAYRNGLMCGEIADFTTFSFHAVKNLTTAEGGAVVWKSFDGMDSQEVYQKYQILSLHGQSKDALAKTQLGAWEYDILSPAYKCNMTDIMAAIGRKQLERYPGMLEARHAIISRYDRALRPLGIETLDHSGHTHRSSGHLYLTRVPGVTPEQRAELIRKLAERGISSNVHYKPLPMLTAYRRLGFDIKDYPNAYRRFCNEITLPLHTRLTEDEVTYIIDTYTEMVPCGL